MNADDLRDVMLAAIRYRASVLHPPSIAAKDRDWLLAEVDRLRAQLHDAPRVDDVGPEAIEALRRAGFLIVRWEPA